MISNNSNYVSTCLDWIPPAYRDIQEFKALANAYNIEMNRIMEYLISVHNNRFIESLNEYGCDRWEEMLNIRSLNKDSLEDRRFAIKTKLIGQRPYTFSKVKEILTTLLGAENFILTFDSSRNHMKCLVALVSRNQIRAVKDLLEQTVPVNVSLEVDLMYNTHADLEKFSHAEMEAFTHTELREGEI